MTHAARVIRTSTVLLVVGACSSGSPSISLEPRPSTTAPATATSAPIRQGVRLVVDVEGAGDDISPLILGISGDADTEHLRDLGTTLRSWGGDQATRFNHELGNASNGGAAANYRNGPVGLPGDAVAAFVAATSAAGLASRIAVPTLGWVAADTEPTTCSFPLPDGGCGDGDGADCTRPGPVADPNTTSVVSDATRVASWISRIVADPGTTPRFIAMDNEPELWGINHYDVHPECTTYEEVLLKYIAYASAIRGAAPDVELMGPVMCCWFDYWLTAPGPADGSGEDFLTWFLRKVHEDDRANGRRTLDVVDVHYYPQADVVNDRVDPETVALRIRSTRSLYDALYTDESWVAARIQLLPRLQQIIDAGYPGAKIGISEWSWGASGDMSGALAIADVLGIFGREGVYIAAYSEVPEPGSPGAFAFKMHGNYDGQGGRFGGRSVRVTADGIDLFEQLGAFAAIDEATGVLRVMLVNKQPEASVDLTLDVRSFSAATSGRVFRYGPDHLGSIVEEDVDLATALEFTLAPFTITLIELPASG